MYITGVDKWVLPSYYPQVDNYDTRINVYYGGAGSGKSHFVTQKLVLKALSMYRKVLVIRKVGSTIKDSIWTLFREVLGEIPNAVRKVNKTDFEITLSNGSIIIFKGLDDPEKSSPSRG